MGIDPGTRVMGYGVIAAAKNELHYVECGTITAPRGAALEVRLAEMAHGLSEVIREFQPQAVAVEEAFIASNAHTALALGHARGMVLAMVGMAGLKVYAYAPTRIKKAVTGRGRASKFQVSHMVCTIIGLRTLPITDAADALAVAIAHAHLGCIA